MCPKAIVHIKVHPLLIIDHIIICLYNEYSSSYEGFKNYGKIITLKRYSSKFIYIFLLLEHQQRVKYASRFSTKSKLPISSLDKVEITRFGSQRRVNYALRLSTKSKLHIFSLDEAEITHFSSQRRVNYTTLLSTKSKLHIFSLDEE